MSIRLGFEHGKIKEVVATGSHFTGGEKQVMEFLKV